MLCRESESELQCCWKLDTGETGLVTEVPATRQGALLEGRGSRWEPTAGTTKGSEEWPQLAVHGKLLSWWSMFSVFSTFIWVLFIHNSEYVSVSIRNKVIWKRWEVGPWYPHRWQYTIKRSTGDFTDIWDRKDTETLVRVQDNLEKDDSQNLFS